MKKSIIFLSLLLFTGLASAKVIKIKFATLAPEGSTWLNIMKEFDKEISEKTNGEVKFKIYAGGVQGDEKDVLRKIRINQLQSGGFTGVGLGEILPEVRILESPFLLKNHDEIDYVSEKFFDRFAKKFEQKGYILLGWTEVGFVYVYTNSMVKTIEDFKGVKMWMWEGDPLAEVTFRSFGISPTPLSITDVLTSLQTGLIDGVYISPLACVSLQWFTKLKYMVDAPLTNSIGAVLVSKKAFKKLNAEQQKTVKEAGKKYFKKLTRLSREDNKKSTELMLNQGMKRIEINDAATLQAFEEIGEKARKDLVGRLYDAQLLEEMESAIKEFRAERDKK